MKKKILLLVVFVLFQYSTIYAQEMSVTGTVTDESGNTTTTNRIVNIIPVPDTTPPVLTLLGQNPVNIIVNSVTSYIDSGGNCFCWLKKQYHDNK